MDTILRNRRIGNLPVGEITVGLEMFLEPVLAYLPEKRLREVAKLAVQGIIGGQSPLVVQIARGVAREDETIWPMAKRSSIPTALTKNMGWMLKMCAYKPSNACDVSSS